LSENRDYMTVFPIKEYEEMRSDLEEKLVTQLKLKEEVEFLKGTMELEFEFESQHKEKNFELVFNTNHVMGHGMHGKALVIRVNDTGIFMTKQWDQEETVKTFFKKTEIVKVKGSKKTEEKEIVYERDVTKYPKKIQVLKAHPKKLRIYLDVDSVEIFADEGRWMFTIRIPDTDAKTHIKYAQVIVVRCLLT
jgi:sucrose-6-phosphate hydrolase SacC (GH32 family)